VIVASVISVRSRSRRPWLSFFFEHSWTAMGKYPAMRLTDFDFAQAQGMTVDPNDNILMFGESVKHCSSHSSLPSKQGGVTKTTTSWDAGVTV
jgi:hypothetical protein